MVSSVLDQVMKFVDDSYKSKRPHFERTVYWLKKLEPDADEALLVAAYAHDIERAFRLKKKLFKFDSAKKEREHQEKGGKIMRDFLISIGCDKKFSNRVRDLISHHEVGGNPDQDLLKDADSISFLEVSAIRHAKKKWLSKGEILRKVVRMYTRITSETAREFAKPFYKRAREVLEKNE